MSLVVAAHNDDEIVIASDSLSTSTKTGLWATDNAIQKVRDVNSRLVFAITGRYMSDKVLFFSRFISAVTGETQLDAALDTLFNMAAGRMQLYQSEGFRMSLIGFNDEVPGFRCVDAVKGEGFVAASEPYHNYWVSGEEDPVEHALRMIEAHGIAAKPATATIETSLRAIVTGCIDRYPRTLGKPVEVRVLSAIRT